MQCCIAALVYVHVHVHVHVYAFNIIHVSQALFDQA